MHRPYVFNYYTCREYNHNRNQYGKHDRHDALLLQCTFHISQHLCTLVLNFQAILLRQTLLQTLVLIPAAFTLFQMLLYVLCSFFTDDPIYV